MDILVAKFYDLYDTIIKNQSQISQSLNKESTAIEIANSYLAKLTHIKNDITNQYSSYITQKFFYVMIGMYDGIMVKYLTQNCGIDSGFFNTNSLEVKYYKTANFGQQFFIDAADVLQNGTLEIMKVYLYVYNLLFIQRANSELRDQISRKIYGELQVDNDLFDCEKTHANNHAVFNAQMSYVVPIIAVATYLIASTVIWETNIAPIKKKITQLVAVKQV